MNKSSEERENYRYCAAGHFVVLERLPPVRTFEVKRRIVRRSNRKSAIKCTKRGLLRRFLYDKRPIVSRSTINKIAEKDSETIPGDVIDPSFMEAWITNGTVIKKTSPNERSTRNSRGHYFCFSPAIVLCIDRI